MANSDRSRASSFTAAAAFAALAFSPSGSAQAADITFAVIGPREYELPVNFKPFDVFVQYGMINNQASTFTNTGRTIDGPGGNLLVGLSKYVHFFTLDALPNVGLAYEVIIPTVRIDVPGTHVGGIGDPLTGPAAWIKPTPESTLGVQSFMQFPVGTREVSNNYYANYSSVFFDYQWPAVSFTGNIGGVFRTDSTTSGAPDVSQGSTFHVNLRWGWKNSTSIEPFIAYDFQSTGVSRFVNTNITAIPANHETALGAGLMFTFSPTTSLTLRYSRGIDGRNVVRTDGGYLKFVYLW